ncbi:LCP family protein [Acetobacterium bakii]|uniref:LCP family protein n=1 Tax=Acetobacterium bakii TaxID=52689 RepID=UPI000A64BC42|nr:LCP family protein [Acetobacterium bakii]
MKKKIILVVLVLLVSLIGTGLVYGFNTLSQLNEIVAEPKLDKTDLKVNNDLDIDTVNIAVFGIDGRSDVDGDRADTIMVLSMDFRNGTVKVTSIMRDLMVQIPATDDTYESFDKINASYAYGGPELTVKTLNENFDLNITDYVVVNFDAMVDTVDALGGVEIDVKNEDVLEWTNKYIDDVNDKVGKSDPKLEAIGPQTVTGVQALAYARNRFSDDDFGRTERQREVVGQIAKKGFQIDALTGVNLLSKVYPYVKTTLSIKELTTYAKAFLESTDKEFLEFRVPTDKFVTDAMINNVSYVIPNSLADNVIALHAFIYGPKQTQVAADDTSTSTSGTSSSSSTGTTNSSSSSSYTPYVPTDRVMEISDAIAYYAGSSPSVTTNTNNSESTYSETYSETTNDTTYNNNTTETKTKEPINYDNTSNDPIVSDPIVSDPITNSPTTTEPVTANPDSETTAN